MLCLFVHDELIVDAAEEDAVAAAEIMQTEMVAALLEFFPIATELGVESVADASICDSWAQKEDPRYKLGSVYRKDGGMTGGSNRDP